MRGTGPETLSSPMPRILTVEGGVSLETAAQVGA